MSAELRVKLIGPPAAYIGDEPVSGFVSIKAQALLFYLAATRETHRRDALAALLWSDVPDRVAKKNLRDVLYNLRQLLGPFLIITRHEVGLDPAAPTKIDSQYLLQTLTAARSTPSMPAPISANTLQTLAAASDPHQGEFLAGFYAPDAPLFEEWMLAEREHLRLELANALQNLTGYSLAFGDYAAAEAYARRQLELDSYRETAHRQLMTALALSGRRAEAAAHYETLVALLEDELGLQPAQITQELIAQIQAEEKIPIAFAAKPVQPSDNLPPQLTAFIGRECELEQITDLLLNETDCRLLTLIGPGGIGKTRLGTEAARKLLPTFTHGIYFVSLAPVQETSFIVPAMGKALNFRFQGIKDPKEQLIDYLRPMQTLLLVDNCEHLLDGVDLLSEILASAPGVKLLATSRERLNIREEWVYEVRGLSYPSPFDLEQAPGRTSLEKYDAIRLFIQYARRADAAFSIPTEELPHAVHLCQLLDGMPLGLELAASWVRTLAIREITAEAAKNLDFLSTTLRNVPDRHRSMRAVFEQSWQRLSVDEQYVLANLSVFRGGCRREAAEKVAGANLFILSSLIEKALLRRSPDGRYDIHELIRQFASAQLSIHTTNYESARNRHSAYYADFLHRLEEDTVGWNMLNTFNLIGEENDNIFAALRWAITQKDAAVFEQAAESLVQYWPYPSLERQGELIIGQAVMALTGTAKRGIDVYDPLLSPKLSAIVGFLLAIQGMLLFRISSPQEGHALLEQGISLQDASSPRHKRRLALSKYWLGWNLILQGKYQKAVLEFHEALALFSDVQYPHGMAWSLFQLGRVSYSRGQFAEAEKASAKGRKLCDKYGFFVVGGAVRLTQARVAIEQGNYTRAMNLLNRSLTLHRDVGTYYDLARLTRVRGRLYLLLGLFDRAKEDLDQSLGLFRKHGSDWFYDISLNITADLNRLQGNYEEAEELFNRCLSAARTVNHQRLTAYTLSGLGTVAYDRGEYVIAEQFQREALLTFRKLGNEPKTASTLRYLGHAALALGKDEHKQHYLEALQLANTHRLAPVALDVLVGIARFYAQCGKGLEAVELLTIVSRHASSTYETKTNAVKTWEAVTAAVDEEPLAIAQSHGRQRKLWQTTREILSVWPATSQ